MLLTKQKLNLILENLRVAIPAHLKKELLAEYGDLATDDEGHLVEYTEQDIYEQLRKRLRPYIEDTTGMSVGIEALAEDDGNAS